MILPPPRLLRPMPFNNYKFGQWPIVLTFVLTLVVDCLARCLHRRREGVTYSSWESSSWPRKRSRRSCWRASWQRCLSPRVKGCLRSSCGYPRRWHLGYCGGGGRCRCSCRGRGPFEVRSRLTPIPVGLICPIELRYLALAFALVP